MKLLAIIPLLALAALARGEQPDVHCHWKDLLRFDPSAGKLRADATPTSWLADAIQGRPVLVKIDDAPDSWRVTSAPSPGSQARPGGWTISAAAEPSAVDAGERFSPRSITVIPGHISVVGEGRVGGKLMRTEFYLIGDQSAQLTLQDQSDHDNPPRILREPTLAAMIQAHPVEMRRYVWPLMDAIAGEHVLRPRAVDIYRAFDEIQPEAQASEQVQKILADFAAPDGARRDAASKKLAEIGAPAVLALMNVDAQSLSPEQKSRVDRYLAKNTLGLSPAKSRRDEFFLIDCLIEDDRRVRQATKAALVELTGQPVEFDIDANVTSREQAHARMIDGLLSRAATKS